MCGRLSHRRLVSTSQPGCNAEGHEGVNSLLLAAGLPNLGSLNRAFGSSWFI